MKVLKIFGVLIVLLLVILVIVDRVGVAIAEGRIASSLQSKFDLTSSPEVGIHGFPVLAQAIVGRYDSIDIKARDVPVQTIGAVDVKISLQGLRLTLSDAIAGRMQDATASQVIARVSMNDRAIGNALGMPVEITALDAQTARLNITATVAGVKIPIRADVHVAVDGAQVALNIDKLTAVKVPIPGSVSSQITKVLNSKLTLPQIAGGLSLKEVIISDGSITAVAEGHEVPLGG